MTARSGGYLLLADLHLLRAWGYELERMFPDHIAVLHVGSSLTRPDYRDVDIRVVLSDDQLTDLCVAVDLTRLNVALSLWGRSATSLPIDCQLQGFTTQQAEKGPRNGIGVRPELLAMQRYTT